jgi:hypothetical protein
MDMFLVRHRWRWLLGLVVAMTAVWGLATLFVLRSRSTAWGDSLALAQALLILANLLALWPYAMATVAQFVTESIERLKQNKPVVFTDVEAGGPVIRNVGGSFVVNVWYLEESGEPVPLGSLGVGEARPPQQIVDRPHLLLAEAQPLTGRPWTISINAPVGSAVVHSFAVSKKIDREVPISEFLTAKRVGLLAQLKAQRAATVGAA